MRTALWWTGNTPHFQSIGHAFRCLATRWSRVFLDAVECIFYFVGNVRPIANWRLIFHLATDEPILDLYNYFYKFKFFFAGEFIWNIPARDVMCVWFEFFLSPPPKNLMNFLWKIMRAAAKLRLLPTQSKPFFLTHSRAPIYELFLIFLKFINLFFLVTEYFIESSINRNISLADKWKKLENFPRHRNGSSFPCCLATVSRDNFGV